VPLLSKYFALPILQAWGQIPEKERKRNVRSLNFSAEGKRDVGDVLAGFCQYPLLRRDRYVLDLEMQFIAQELKAKRKN
jgi:hypothetical protein